MRVSLAACHEPAGSYNRLLEVLYVFEHKTQYLSVHDPHTPLWYFDISVICTHKFRSWVKFVIIPHVLYSCNIVMMMSSNGNIFRVTGHFCGEFTGHRWILRTKTSDAEIWCFLWSSMNKWLSKQSWCWWFETPPGSLWRHCNCEILLYKRQLLVITCELIYVVQTAHC